MRLLKWMLATAMVLDAALVLTARIAPTTSPVQSVGMSVDQDSNAAINVAVMNR